MVTLRRGPYGSYVQLGEANKEDKKAPKPKRASLPKGLPAADVDLEKALSLLALPRRSAPIRTPAKKSPPASAASVRM